MLFGINSNSSVKGDMFAHDLNIRLADESVGVIQEKLEVIANKINKYCLNWHLNIIYTKCLTVLFRQPMEKLSNINRFASRKFYIKIWDPKIKCMVRIPHEKETKYLGVKIDNMLRLHIYPAKQLEKAKRVFQINSKLFYSSLLNKEAKLICYQLLVRPIMTYAAPIWFNISASSMEQIRIFESACLRVCLNKYRTPQ